MKGEGLFYNNFALDLNKKTREKGFRRACLSAKFVSLHVLFFNAIEEYKNVLLYCFRVMKWPFLVILCFLTLFSVSQLLVAGYLPPMWKMLLQIIILRPHVVLTLSYQGFFGVAEPWGGGGGGLGSPLRISLILHLEINKLGTIVDCDKLYFILVVKVLNWL